MTSAGRPSRITGLDEAILSRLVARYGYVAIHTAIGRITHRSRGRPKKNIASLKYLQLADIIDDIAVIYSLQGHSAPKSAALAEVAEHESHEKGRAVPVKTIERYYRLGIAQRGK